MDTKEILARWKKIAKRKGYLLSKNKDLAALAMASATFNGSCPCLPHKRPVCPCIQLKEEIEKQGHCFCGVFVKK